MHNSLPFHSGDDLNVTTSVVIFPSDSNNGTIHCQNISIVNDGVREEIQNITLGLNTTDSQVVLSPSSATIIIIDNDSELNQYTIYVILLLCNNTLIFSCCPWF